MPFIPFAATVGGWFGTSAAVGGAIIAGTAATATAVGTSISGSTAQASAARRAAGAAAAQNAKAIADIQTAKDTAASQAQGALTDKQRAIARSRSIFTSPLGLATQAETSKKVLLGE